MGNDANTYVAGHVVLFLSIICLALFTTAATIIRQLIHTYNAAFKVLLPLIGYHLLRLGVPIAGLLDTGSMGRRLSALPFLPAALLDPAYLGKGLGMAWRLLREKITTFGVTRIAAEGSGKVEEVRFTADGREHRISADLLITHDAI